MPIVSYFFVVGSILLGLLFGVDAILPPVSPAIVSSNFQGLPKRLAGRAGPPRDDRTPAPEPDMSSPPVLAAMPEKPVPKLAVAAAPAPPKHKKQRVAARRPQKTKQAWRDQNWRDQGWRDRGWRDHLASGWSRQADNGRWNWRGFP